MTQREELAALLTRYGLTQARAASLISQNVERSCSVRSIKAWLSEPERPSSRPCPEWAIQALKRALNAE